MQWYTTRVNRVFVYLGRQYPRAIAVWFAAGAVVGVLAMVASVATLCYTVVSQVLYPPDQQVLTAVVRRRRPHARAAARCAHSPARACALTPRRSPA